MFKITKTVTGQRISLVSKFPRSGQSERGNSISLDISISSHKHKYRAEKRKKNMGNKIRNAVKNIEKISKNPLNYFLQLDKHVTL